jgi:hypothetical protein
MQDNHSFLIANKSYGNVAQFKYLEVMVKDQVCIRENIKSSLNFGNACYHLVHILLSSCPSQKT